MGRAPGLRSRDRDGAQSRSRTRPSDFPARCRSSTCGCAASRFPGTTRSARSRAHPPGPPTPQIWILGSSDYGAQLAAHFGLPYAFAYFFTEGRGTEEALALYRRNYRPSARHPQPQATICVWALAADTEDEARRLLTTREHWRVGFEKGLRTPLLSPEAAAAHPYTEAERSIVQRLRERAIVGTADQVASKLAELATTFGLDEIVVNTWTHDPAARHRSYELIAQAALNG